MATKHGRLTGHVFPLLRVLAYLNLAKRWTCLRESIFVLGQENWLSINCLSPISNTPLTHLKLGLLISLTIATAILFAEHHWSLTVDGAT